MTSRTRQNRIAGLVALCLTVFSIPALAVINQTITYPDAQSIQSATLSIDGLDEPIEGEVQDEDDGKKVVFIVPDGYEGKSATANVVVDNVPGSYPVVIGARTPVFRTSGGRASRIQDYEGWRFGLGFGAGMISSKFAEAIARQSELDASGLLFGQGFENITSDSSADDSAFAREAMLELGYGFANGHRLSVDVRKGSSSDFDINVNVRSDVPMTNSEVTAQSIATGELDFWSANVNYHFPFAPNGNWGVSVSAGSLNIDRDTSFTSEISFDGMLLDSTSGSEKLDESVFQYGVGLEWTNQQARTWIPTVGVRISQTGDIEILDNEKVQTAEVYFILNRRSGGRR